MIYKGYKQIAYMWQLADKCASCVNSVKIVNILGLQNVRGNDYYDFIPA